MSVTIDPPSRMIGSAAAAIAIIEYAEMSSAVAKVDREVSMNRFWNASGGA